MYTKGNYLKIDLKRLNKRDGSHEDHKGNSYENARETGI